MGWLAAFWGGGSREIRGVRGDGRDSRRACRLCDDRGLPSGGVYLYFDEIVYAEQVFKSLLYGGEESSFHLVFYECGIGGYNQEPVGYGLWLKAAEESVDLDGVDRVVAFHLGADKLPGFVKVAGVYHSCTFSFVR